MLPLPHLWMDRIQMTYLSDINSLIFYAIVIYLSGCFSGIVLLALSAFIYCGQGNSIILSNNEKTCRNLISRHTSPAILKQKTPFVPTLTQGETSQMYLRIMGRIYNRGGKCGMRWRLNLPGKMSGLRIGSPFIFHTEKRSTWRKEKLCFGFSTKTVQKPFSLMENILLRIM